MIKNEHLSHSAAPYSEALVEQMALKKQKSDQIELLGCLYEEKASWVCTELLLEEKSLEIEILIETLLQSLSEAAV